MFRLVALLNVNMCSIDLSKVFDKMNKMSHHGLFTKLMEKYILVNLLSLLERWFALSETCVKWGQVVSSFVNLLCGVRQGGVLSPNLFAVFVDSIVDKIKSRGLGCYVKWTCMSVLLYADDIVLLAPSVTSLQQLLLVCEHQLYSLDMAINAKKSSCIRIGPRFNADCCNIITEDCRGSPVVRQPPIFRCLYQFSENVQLFV